MKLPTINRPIDNTALSTYMKCPWEYKLAMHDGWRPKEKKQALSFGAFWHLLLETHYKHGGELDAVFNAYEQHHTMVPDTGDYRTAQRALMEYKKYRKWVEQQIPGGIQGDVEQTIGFPDAPMVEISTAVASDQLVHEYAGKLDRIVVVDGKGYVEDHKTTSRRDKGYFQQFELSNQMMGYVWMAQQLVPDIPIHGVRINLLHCLTNKSNFERERITYTQGQIDQWVENTNQWLKRLSGAIESEDFPRHYGDNGCNGRYGRCQFFDVCSSAPMIQQGVLEQNFHIDPWDPLADESTPNGATA